MRLARYLIIALAMLAVSAGAQDAQKGVSNYGFKLGLTFSKSNTTNVWLDQASHLGGTFGAFLEYRLSPTISIQPEIAYIEKGSGEDLLLLGLITGITDLQYLEVPVLLEYNPRTKGEFKPSIYAGPAFAVLMSAEYRLPFLEGDLIDSKDGNKGFDLGFAFGAELAYRSVLIDFRYTVGLTNIADVDGWNKLLESQDTTFDYSMEADDEIKNQCFSLIFGIKFGQKN